MPAAFDPATVLKPSAFTPYPYQKEGVKRVVAEFKRGIKSTLLVMPTGCGKTPCLAWVTRWAISQGQRALILAHREELNEQLANTHAELGVPVAIEQADRHARVDNTWLDPYSSGSKEPVCVIASKDSMQGKRLESWPKDYFGMISTDEGHHAVSDTYANIYNHFDSRWKLFVTATPDRLDGQDMGSICESIAFQYPIRQAITEGWLCRPKFVRCKLQIDLRKFTKRKMKDFSDSDIAEAIKPHMGQIANAIKQEIGDRPTIAFCPDIMTSEFLASALASIGVSAESICGVSPGRREIMDGFRTGTFQVLANAMLLTEGVDLPKVAAIVYLRPTMSRALYSQMTGRALRKGKPDALLIDFNWITEQHQLLVGPTELFDTYDTDSEVGEDAKRKAEEGAEDGPVDLLDLVERAEEEHRERVKIRIQVREQRVRYERIVYDPFAVMEAVGIPIREEAPSSAAIPASEKQINLLTKLGVVGAHSMSRRRATIMLDRLLGRSKEGLATFKQVAHLVSNGVETSDARKMTKKEATAYLETIWGKKKDRKRA